MVCEKLILTGDYDSLFNGLGNFKRQWGASYWLAETIINSTQLAKGFKAQKEKAQSILDLVGRSSLCNYYVSWMSSRAEENVSASQFIRMLERFAPTTAGVIGQANRIRLGLYAALTPSEAAEVLWLDSAAPLLDRYLSLIRTIQCLVASRSLSDFDLDAVRTAVHKLSVEIDDPALRRLETLLSAEAPARSPGPESLDLLAVLDAYTAGDYHKAIELAQELRTRDPAQIEATHVLAKSLSILGDEYHEELEAGACLSDRIFHLLREVTSFREAGHEAFLSLTKIGQQFAGAVWSPALNIVLIRQHQDDRIEPAGAPLLYEKLRTPYDNPFLAVGFEPSWAKGYTAIGFPGYSPTYQLAKIFSSNHEYKNEALNRLALPQNRRMRFAAMLLMRDRNYSDAIKELEDAEYTDDVSKYEAHLLLAKSLLESGSIIRCANVCATLYLMSSYFARVLPISRLVSSIADDQENADEPVSLGSASMAIVLDIYYKYVSNDLEVLRSDAYKDFLRDHEVTRPSKLAEDVSQFKLDELIYFLHNICVPEVMDQSLALPSTRDIEEERLSVLKILSDLDPDKRRQKEYLEEVREITTKHVLKDTTKQLDQSKIYVNVDGVKKSSEVTMRDSWGRYIFFRQAGSGSQLAELQAFLAKAGVTLIEMNTPETERKNLFTSMVQELTERFVHSREYGLDANLSTNIRHGYIRRELRSPLVAANLVTNKASASGDYLDNEYWLARVASDPAGREILTSSLSAFSEKVDHCIDHLNNSVIRIKSATNPHGLFDYTLFSAGVSLLEQQCASVEGYDDFFDKVISYLWHRTEKNLVQVRDYLASDVAPALNSALDELQSSLEGVSSPGNVAELNTAVAMVRPEVRASIERAASWLTLSGEDKYSDYHIRLAYEAGLQTIRRYYNQHHISAHLECDDNILLQGYTLPVFARLFFILLDNAATHSTSLGDSLSIETRIVESAETLEICMTNVLGDDVDLSWLSERANNLENDYLSDGLAEYVKREGGSGFAKVWKMLTHDLLCRHLMSAQVSDRKFVVTILMSKERVVACAS